MFAFSEIMNRDGNGVGKQMLVFPTQELKIEFDAWLANKTATPGLEYLDTHSTKVVYRIYAVQELNGDWLGCICCSLTGRLLWGTPRLSNELDCFRQAVSHLLVNTNNAINAVLSKLDVLKINKGLV